jgi:hypothetical protein
MTAKLNKFDCCLVEHLAGTFTTPDKHPNITFFTDGKFVIKSTTGSGCISNFCTEYSLVGF